MSDGCVGIEFGLLGMCWAAVRISEKSINGTCLCLPKKRIEVCACFVGEIK